MLSSFIDFFRLRKHSVRNSHSCVEQYNSPAVRTDSQCLFAVLRRSLSSCRRACREGSTAGFCTLTSLRRLSGGSQDDFEAQPRKQCFRLLRSLSFAALICKLTSKLLRFRSTRDFYFDRFINQFRLGFRFLNYSIIVNFEVCLYCFLSLTFAFYADLDKTQFLDGIQKLGRVKYDTDTTSNLAIIPISLCLFYKL